MSEPQVDDDIVWTDEDIEKARDLTVSDPSVSDAPDLETQSSDLTDEEIPLPEY